MNTGQKLIKYGAILLAFFLIFHIALAGLWALRLFGGFLGLTSQPDISYENMEVIATETAAISELNIDINFLNLVIERGDTFEVKTNYSSILYEREGAVVTILEDSSFWGASLQKDEECLVVTLPDTLLERVHIETGTGMIKIHDLDSNYFVLDQGAGKVDIHNMIVYSETELQGGAGKMNITSSTLTNVNFDLGVGAFSFDGQILGKSEVNAGVGTVSLQFIDDISHYQFQVNKGIGSIKIQGEDARDDETIGSGPNLLLIDGGIGSIEISLAS